MDLRLGGTVDIKRREGRTERARLIPVSFRVCCYLGARSGRGVESCSANQICLRVDVTGRRAKCKYYILTCVNL